MSPTGQWRVIQDQPLQKISVNELIPSRAARLHRCLEWEIESLHRPLGMSVSLHLNPSPLFIGSIRVSETSIIISQKFKRAPSRIHNSVSYLYHEVMTDIKSLSFLIGAVTG